MLHFYVLGVCVYLSSKLGLKCICRVWKYSICGVFSLVEVTSLDLNFLYVLLLATIVWVNFVIDSSIYNIFSRHPC